ncbi:MAG: LicD family protein [Bacteroidales bacterium]|nr:LicD family protein [Bacteroidales bacterium]
MRSITAGELKSIQLEILEAFGAYCTGRGLRYSISNGTLIGSVIYGGYIPWDDDIDITMPRADYDRLVNEFPDLLDGRYRLLSLERNPRWDRFFAKVCDERTVMLENRIDAVETGVNIDIFPADAVPDGHSQLNKWRRSRLLLHRVYELKDRRLSSSRAWWKTLLLIPAKLLLFPVSKRLLCERAEKEAKRWNSVASGRLVCSLVNGYHLTKPYPAESFDSLEDTLFEGRPCKRMTDYDSYLRAGYGNYMRNIPEEKQVSHHCFEAYSKD